MTTESKDRLIISLNDSVSKTDRAIRAIRNGNDDWQTPARAVSASMRDVADQLHDYIISLNEPPPARVTPMSRWHRVFHRHG